MWNRVAELVLRYYEDRDVPDAPNANLALIISEDAGYTQGAPGPLANERYHQYLHLRTVMVGLVRNQ